MRWLAVAALALGALAGCDSDDRRGSGREGGSIVVGLAKAPGSWDPAFADNPALRLTHTPPFRYSNAGTGLEAGLATEPPPDEPGQALSFQIRDGLRYSDGRLVKGADFARAIRRSSRLNPRARRAFRNVSAVLAVGRSVTLALRRPDPLLAYALASPWAAPVPAGGGTPGVGPYRRSADGKRLVRRRPFSLPGVPSGNVDIISFHVEPSAARRTQEVLDGTIDATEADPPAGRLPRIRSEFKDRYSEFPTLATQLVRFDLSRPPFSRRDARRAVAYALDERDLTRLSDGFMAPACNVLPPAVAGYRKADPCPFGEREGNSDLVRASELITSADRVLVDGQRELARYGAATLSKIGLRARVARTAAERRRAQVRFESLDPALPHPARYLETVRDDLLGSRVALLERAGLPSGRAERWAQLDSETVSDALVAPFGVRLRGVVLSERLDSQNCLQFHPIFGLDLASLCLR